MEHITPRPPTTLITRAITGLKPMSVNHVWRGGRRFRTEEYRKYEQDLHRLIGMTEKIEGFVRVSFAFTLPKSSFGRSDLDNFIKPLLDSLVNHGCIEDDCKVLEITTRKILGDEFKIEFIIQKMRFDL